MLEYFLWLKNFFIPDLLGKNFILLHVNCHAHVGEHYYFPAEIAVLDFNLLNGVSRTFHRIIGLCKYTNISIMWCTILCWIIVLKWTLCR